MMRSTMTSGHARQPAPWIFGADPSPLPYQGCDDGGMVRGPRSIQAVVLLFLAVGVIAGLGTAWLAWLATSFSRAAASPLTLALMCVAGWSLMFAGAITLSRQGGRTKGLALLAAGFAWFVSEWVNPASAPAIVFTLGLVFTSAWPALLAQALLDGGSRPAASPRVRRLVVAVAYTTNLGMLGILPTLAFDPVKSRCSLCPDNLLALASDPGLVAGATRLGFVVQAGWVLGALALIGWGLVRASVTERRRTAAVALPAAIALAAAGLEGVYSIERGLLSNDPVDTALWSVAAVALVAVGAGEAAGWLRRRQTRQRIAHLALELAAAPAAGELAPALGRELGDSTLEVLYPLDDGQLVDAAGVARATPADATRITTRVHRGGAPVAVLVHRADLASDAERIAGAVDAARLALENERLHAQSQARLLELRKSRSQIVSAADAERRRLERDLHDGSQQRLLAFAIDIAIARQRASGAGASNAVADSDVVALEGEVRAALEDLRELAHGIIPRALADDGLGAALEELAERSAIPIDLVAIPNGRLDRAVEAAAYIVVTRATGDPAVRRASIDVRLVGGRLIVDLGLDLRGEIAAATIVDLEDRCGAVDGTMELNGLPEGRTRVRAEIPCGS
jgi:signal transduction histidine kinase